MKNKTAKQLLTIYYVILALLTILYIATPTVLALFIDFPWVLLVVTLVLIYPYNWLGTQASQIILNPLYKELDPAKQIQLIKLAPTAFYGSIYIPEAARHNGDAQTAINICHNAFVNYNNISFLSLRANIHFQYDDVESLKHCCYLFDEAVPPYTAELQKLRNKFGVFKFYRLYVSGKYTDCLAYNAGLNKKLMKRINKSKEASIRFKYSNALLNYKAGNMDVARQEFAEIIVQAPKIHLATLSRKYLDAMDAGVEYISDVHLEPNDQPITLGKKPTFNYQKKLIAIVALTIVVSAIVQSVR